MDELEAYAKTLANRTQCHANKGVEASPISSKRKRDVRILHDNNDSEAEGSTPDESPKRVRSQSSSEQDFTNGKENKPAAQMDAAGRKGGTSSASKVCMTSQKKAAMRECLTELARDGPSPESMSVKARKALFEQAATKSSCTMPLSRKPPPKPVLKQVFSTVKLVGGDAQHPLSSSVSVQIDAKGVLNTESPNHACVESSTPPAKNESRPPRAPTPNRILRTELVIKRVGSNASPARSSGTASPVSPHFEYLKACFNPNRENVAEKPTEVSRSSFQNDAATKDSSSVLCSVTSPTQDVKMCRSPDVQSNEESHQMEVSECASTSRSEQEPKPVLQNEQQSLKLGCESILRSADDDCAVASSVNSTVRSRMSLESSSVDVVEPEQPEEEPDESNGSIEDEDEVFQPKDEPAAQAAVTNSIVKRAIASLTSNIRDKSIQEHAGCSTDQDSFSEECPRPSLISAEEAEVFDEMDEILDSALEDECSDTSTHIDQTSCRSPTATPVKTAGRVRFADSSDTQFPSPQKGVPGAETKSLPHTISFYRRQQQSLTPKKSTRGSITSPGFPTPTKAQLDIVPLGNRIRALQDEVMAQQTIIGQASQALNLCHASAEFLGSEEQTEGERLLLIATQRRLACLNEIQRLKLGYISEGSQLKGNFKITQIQFPLKPSFVGPERESKQGDEVYYFLCLVQYGSQVVPSPMVSTADLGNATSLVFDKVVVFSDVTEDFQVVVDVYALKTRKAAVSHDKKYHIKKDSLRLKLPTKGRRNDTKLFLSTAVSSPGGPDAVRTSSFQLLGSVVISCDTCGEKVLPLMKVPTASPLEGKVTVTTRLCADHKIEHRGFLTLFQDVGGLGAWTRLWCLLKGSNVLFWRYPDEEQEKVPLDSVDLRQCINKDISLLSRMECGRPNTFRLILVRPLEGNEVDTITVKKHSTVVSVTHLFSADTKEEGVVWCKKLSTVLSCIRKWDVDAFQALGADGS